MPYVIKCRGYAAGIPCPHEGQYLKEYNPNAVGGEPVGTWTYRESEAKKFDSFEDVLEEWRRVRTVDGGKRADGKPDRPLTAYNIEPVRVVEG